MSEVALARAAAIEAENVVLQIYRRLRNHEVITFDEQTSLISDVKVRLQTILRHDSNRLGIVVLVLGDLYSKLSRHREALHYLYWAIDIYNPRLKSSVTWTDLGLEGAPPDIDFIKDKLICAFNLSGAVLERTGSVTEAASNFSKSSECSLGIPPNLAIDYSEHGFHYCKLAFWAVKTLDLDKALYFGLKCSDAYLAYQQANTNRNRFQLGKCERIVSVIYLLKGHEEESSRWNNLAIPIMEATGISPVWLDVDFLEIEILISRNLYAKAQIMLNRIFAANVESLWGRFQTQFWQTLLYHHQRNRVGVDDSIAALKKLMKQSSLLEDAVVTDTSLINVACDISQLLVMCRKQRDAAALLVDQLLFVMNMRFPANYELGIKSCVYLLKATLSLSRNQPREAAVMECLLKAQTMLTDWFGAKHYIMAQCHQCLARAHQKFERPDDALQSMDEAESILLMSFGEDSYTLMKFRFQLLALYRVLQRPVDALELARQMVRTMEKVVPHKPFHYDSKWQYAELVLDPLQRHMDRAQLQVNQLVEEVRALGEGN